MVNTMNLVIPELLDDDEYLDSHDQHNTVDHYNISDSAAGSHG